MGLFKKSEENGANRKQPGIDRELLDYAMRFAEGLELPDDSMQIETKLLNGSREQRGRIRFPVKAPYYLAVYSKDTNRLLSAGYVAGQIAILFQNRGIAARILSQIPDSMERRENQQCVAVIALGAGHRKKEVPEHPCIFRETNEDWTRKVLEYSKSLLPMETQTGVRIIRMEQGLHIAAGKYFGRSASQCQFQAGVTLAGVMAAAEELWVELSMGRVNPAVQSQVAGPDYLISVCKKGDTTFFQTGGQVNRTAGDMQHGGQRWKLA